MAKTKQQILKTLTSHGFPGQEVALPLDVFFQGDVSTSSIGVNIFPNQPGPEDFHKILKDLITSKSADKVFVRIADAEEPEDWFFSDTVYVIGDITIDELSQKLEPLSFDEIYDYWLYDEPVNIGTYDKTKKVYSVWWD